MNCPRCGEAVEPGAVFCGNCGQPLQAAPSAPQQAPAAAPTTINVSHVSEAPSAVPTGPAPTPNQMSGPVPGPMPGAVENPPFNPAGPSSAPAPAMGPNPMGPAAPNGPSPIANAIQNGPAAAPAFGAPAGVNPMAAPGGTAAVPSYAMANPANPAEHKAHTRAIVGMVLGILSIPGAIVPFLGMVLAGVAALLSTTSRAKMVKKTTATLGVVFAAIGLVASIGAYAYNYQQLAKERNGSSVSSSSSSSDQSAAGTSAASGVSKEVDTPCYKATLPEMKSSDASATSCNFTASDGTTPSGGHYAISVEAVTNSSLNATNISAVGKQLADSYLKTAVPDFQVTSQQTGTFANSPAYVIHGTKGTLSMEMSLVYHPTAHGENAFVVVGAKDSGEVDNTAFGKAWEWK